MSVDLAMLGPALLSAFEGMIAAASWAALMYLRRRREQVDEDDEGRPVYESFDPDKFLATVLVGAAMGAALGYSGVPLTVERIEARFAMYAGVVVLVEAAAKAIRREVRHRQGAR